MNAFQSRRFGRGLLVAALLAGIAGCAAQARANDGALAAPTGPVVLTVTGAIGLTNAEGAAAFDMDMIEALPMTGFSTSTVWTEGVSRFEGVMLRDLLDRIEARGEILILIALNDYVVEMPAADVGPEGPLLAMRRDGERMSVRDRGPVWLVYPYDSSPEFRSEVVFMRSIWQLVRIEVWD
jgi:hypothetical protein